MAETDLYPPVKRFLEAQGYTVKSEVKSCDVVAMRGDDPPLIVELKTSLTLPLFYQAIDRLAISGDVYIAIARPKRRVSPSAVKLCRRIGIGLIIVAKSGSIEVLADPAPYAPRLNPKRKTQLLKEFSARRGDPNTGGSTRKPIMTVYRQDAMLCAEHLAGHGPSTGKSIKAATGVDRATTIMRDNVYGWFVKQARGIYSLSPAGQASTLPSTDSPTPAALP